MIPAVLKSAAILLITLCGLPLLRRQSAATRHAVLTIGLICALVVPAVSPLLPSWLPKNRVVHLFPHFLNEENSLYEENGEIGERPHFSATSLRPRSDLTAEQIALGVWLAGVGVAAIWLLAGAARIAWLVFRAKPLNGGQCKNVSAEVSRALNLGRRVRLLQNQRTVLGTWGALRPRVLLPYDADNWSDDRLRIVLTHEFAHIKRFDWLVQMLAEFARAVYWFNPLFWIAYRRLRTESEHACDDVVLNAGIDAEDYAAHLLELARTLKNSGRSWSPVLAMAQPPNLERRFVAMLNPSLNHRPAASAAIVAACLVAICVTLPLAAMRAPEQAQQAAVSTPGVLVTSSALAPKAAVPAAPAVPRKKPAVPAPAPAQGLADGSLSGTVYDGSGAVIPSVTLAVSTMTTLNNGDRASVVETTMSTTIAGPTGEYEFRALPAGQYSLKAELPGFTSFRRAWLEIKPSQALTQNVILTVGSISERVTVTGAGQPKPAPLPGTPRRIRVGGNVNAANLISQVKPIYPQSAQDAGIEGIVHLQGLISTDGTLIGLNALGFVDPDLTNAALVAVRQWRYKPTLLNNVPVEVVTTIDVEFKLAQ